ELQPKDNARPGAVGAPGRTLTEPGAEEDQRTQDPEVGARRPQDRLESALAVEVGPRHRVVRPNSKKSRHAQTLLYETRVNPPGESPPEGTLLQDFSRRARTTRSERAARPAAPGRRPRHPRWIPAQPSPGRARPR